MHETIDQETYNDVIGLIEAEMKAVATGDSLNSAERLAGLLLGLLGRELPKESFLPNITQGWRKQRDFCADEDPIEGFWEIRDNSNYRVARKIRREPHADLIAAAPKLAETLFCIKDWWNREIEKHGGNGSLQPYLTENDLPLFYGIIDILREAGANL